LFSLLEPANDDFEDETMKIQNHPALLAALAALALAASGCSREAARSTEQPAQATAPRVAQVTPPPTPPAASPAATEPYVLEESGRTSPPPAAVQPPPAVEPRDVEQPPRAVAPPVKSPKQQPTPAPKADRERRLDSRERHLTQRQADLDARERRLRRQEASPRPSRRVEVPVPDQPAESEPAPVPEVIPERQRTESATPAMPATPATLAAGTKLDVRFDRSLSSATSTVGEIFRARVNEDLYDGDRIAIPAGSEVVGEVTQAGPSKKIGGKSVLGLRFTDIVLPSGETVPLKASFQREGASKSGRDAATVGGATAGGAILGRILSKGGGRGTVLGAIIGAAAGAAIASRNPGEEVTIPEGSVLGIVLDRPVEIQGRR
jgi:type IV secretory pathway VirB10-like protein